MHWYSPHGGPLHCAHISSNYIKFDQGQKEIGLLLAIFPTKSLNIYYVVPMNHDWIVIIDVDALLNDHVTIICNLTKTYGYGFN